MVVRRGLTSSTVAESGFPSCGTSGRTTGTMKTKHSAWFWISGLLTSIDSSPFLGLTIFAPRFHARTFFPGVMSDPSVQIDFPAAH